MPDLTAVKNALRAQRIELPSWAFGNTGTRFKVFAQPGVPRTAQEKIDDAAQVHQFTGVAPTVAVHIPWDTVDDYAELAAYAADQGVRHRHGQRQRVPGRRLQAGQRLPTRTRGSAARRWPPAGVRGRHGRDRLAGPQAVVRRTAPTTRARTTSAARQDRLAEALAEVYQRLVRRPAADAGVQAVRAGLLHHRRARLGHGLRCTACARRAGQGRAWTPGTTRRAPTSSSSWPRCCARAGWAGSTSTPGSTPTTT